MTRSRGLINAYRDVGSENFMALGSGFFKSKVQLISGNLEIRPSQPELKETLGGGIPGD